MQKLEKTTPINPCRKHLKSFVILNILFLIMVFLIIPLSSASSKHYDPATETILIKNFLGQDVVSLQLIDNTYQCLTNCHATIKIHAYKDIDLGQHTDLILNFYNRKIKDALGDELESWDVFYMKKESYTFNVEDYGLCNGTRYINNESHTENYQYACLVGNHEETEEKIVWKPFKASLKNAHLKLGKDYYIKIEGKKKFRSSVEWIPSIYGYDLKEWAFWNASWSKCRDVTILNTGSSTLTDFPAYIYLDNSTGNFSDVQGDWDDIRFVDTICDNEGSELHYDKDNYTTSGGSFHVRTNLSIGITNISVYYGNDAASNGEDKDNTWDDDYVAVYHFSERSGTNAEDVSGTGNNGTLSNFDGTQWDTTGKIGGSVDFVDAGDAIATSGNIGIIGSQPRTVEWWNKFDVADVTSGLIEWGVANGGEMWNLGYEVAVGKKYYLGVYGTDHGTAVVSTTNWTFHSVVYDGSDLHWWINGVNIKNETFAINTADSNLNLGESDYYLDEFAGLFDEVRISNTSRSADWIVENYQLQANQSSYVTLSEEILAGTTTTLISPINAYNTSSSTIDFTCNETASAGINLENVTIYIWKADDSFAVAPNTNDISGTSNLTTWHIGLGYTSGTYRWNCLTYDDTGVYSDWADTNWSFTIDTTAPEINITNPSGSSYYYSDPPYNVSLNYTINETYVDSCWYEIDNNGTNISLPSCSNTTINITAGGDHNITVWVNDTAGNENYTISYFTINYLSSTNDSYDLSAIETQSRTFYLYLNATLITTPNASLVYNGTSYIYDTISNSSTQANFTKIIHIPFVEAEGNMSFYWDYTLDSFNNQTTTHNQTIYKMIVRNSSNNAIHTLNFTLKDEEDDSVINGTLKAHFIIWLDENTANYTNLNRNYSFNEVSAYSHTFYISPNWTSYQTDTQIEYTSQNYTTRNYYLNNATITNSTQNIALYLANATESNLGIVLLRVIDEYDEKITGAYITIMRYYLESGTYKTIEILETDYYGQATTKLVLYDIWYKFLIVYDGESIIETTPLKVVSNEMTFKKGAGESVLQNWISLQNVDYSLTYLNATRTFKFLFTDTSGLVKTGCLKVIHRTGTEDTLLSEECQESSSATITYTLPVDSEGTYVANGWFTINPTESVTLWINIGEKKLAELFGKDGILLAILLVITTAAVGIWNPPIAIIMSIVGLIIAMMLGFTMMSYAAIISIVIVGILLAINMRH